MTTAIRNARIALPLLLIAGCATAPDTQLADASAVV
jgi:hypothetical protein